MPGDIRDIHRKPCHTQHLLGHTYINSTKPNQELWFPCMQNSSANYWFPSWKIDGVVLVIRATQTKKKKRKENSRSVRVTLHFQTSKLKGNNRLPAKQATKNIIVITLNVSQAIALLTSIFKARPSVLFQHSYSMAPALPLCFIQPIIKRIRINLLWATALSNRNGNIILDVEWISLFNGTRQPMKTGQQALVSKVLVSFVCTFD